MRYSRHLLIPEVGEEGQLKLLDSRVLLIGAGGLGSPASLYLAAAGVGTLGIVDDDVVDESNLQRQIVHSTATLGEPKVESASRALRELNPDVQILPYRTRLTSETVDEILDDGWDVIVDGADNFPTRYLLNDASVWHKIPVVHGSIFRFEGQLTVFKPCDGPCYRCLFPQPPPPEMAPSCAEGGVLGVLPGIVGSLQANEALKLALGIGNPLIGRLMLFDALEVSLHRAAGQARPGLPRVRRRPDDHRVHRLRRVLRRGQRRLMASVRIPPPLRTETGGEAVVEASGGYGARRSHRRHLALPLARHARPRGRESRALRERVRGRRGRAHARGPRHARRRGRDGHPAPGGCRWAALAPPTRALRCSTRSAARR